MQDEPKSERRDALAPPRPKHASIADIVEQVVEQKITERLEEVVGSKLDSLVPMNEAQLEYLRESAEERRQRKKADAARVEDRKRGDRFYKILTMGLSIVLVALEIYARLIHASPH